MTGEWPKMIGHRNRVRPDNRWDNCRRATPTLNAYSRTPRELTKSEVRGHFDRKYKKPWIAYIGRGGQKRVHFPTFREAVIAWVGPRKPAICGAARSPAMARGSVIRNHPGLVSALISWVRTAR